ncbi:hypothetical protein [Oceanicella sp. SM1341]|uniref:hypothetical protein n=1 Tax=Oceanicella sp. SM1341 TaxID=1548889 RepID=UPI001E2C1FD2|nr:hypothetical protein [Oceanicella sp. SM1341]
MGIIASFTYRRRADVSEEALLEASAATAEWFRDRPGFVYRSLARDADGLYHELVFWTDEASAAASDAVFFDHAPNRTYVDLVDRASLERARMPELQTALYRAMAPA